MAEFMYEETGIEGLKIISPIVAEDHRGYFLKSFEKNLLKNIGIDLNVTEINESKSSKGVLRGLHMQKEYPQAKLIRVLEGEIYDVAVDLRKDSPTFGQWRGVILSRENRKMYYVPKGFAHGFLALSEQVVITYTCDGEYVPEDEKGLIWNDEDLKIDWPLERVEEVILSEKDKKWSTYKEFCELK